MPGTDGLELVRSAAAQKYPGQPILMTGGHDLYLKMAEDLARAHELRVAAALTKPFRRKRFSFILMTLI